MNQYMIDIELPDVKDERFIKLVPLQRTQLHRLMAMGRIQNYSLSRNIDKLWISMSGKDVEDISDVLDSFPLHEYMKTSIHELSFQESAFANIHQFSLN